MLAGCGDDDDVARNNVQEAQDADSNADDSSTPTGQSPISDSTDSGADEATTGDTTPPKTSDSAVVYNKEALVPPMCYTKTEGTHNPCYVCHQALVRNEGRANRMNDGYLQGDYNFSDYAVKNRWTNLYIDHTQAISKIDNDAIMAWVNEDNYSDLSQRLQAENFGGYIPDLQNLQAGADAFDETGLAKDGSHWVAFNYKPMPGSFWPTNGATDDVLIRLSEPFRSLASGSYSKDIYFLNLAIVEATVKNLTEIDILPFDESLINQDLNGDETMGVVTHIQRPSHYVGGASDIAIDTWLYPARTEFLHTVRYLGIKDDDTITPSTRIKEVRYMYKETAFPKHSLGAFYDNEHQEKSDGDPPRFPYLGDRGLDNKMGWLVQGFIEDQDGKLRPQTYEENLFCMGCHKNLGSTLDQTFAFPRKITGPTGWGYIDLHGMPDAPSLGETEGEIAQYFARAGGGSEFRHNDEVLDKWFTEGTVDPAKIANADVYELLAPSRERALLLNKAYKVIVQEQSFARGRDPVVTPPTNVYEEIDPDEMTPLPPEKHVVWDIRLDWSTNTP